MTFARLSQVIPIPILALALTAMQSVSLAGDHDQNSLPSAASMMGPEVARLEDDIAQLEQKRDAVPAATLPWLEMQIDSRIVARWLLAQSAAGKEQSRVQIAGYLHSTSMLTLVPVIDDFASKQTAGPSAVQAVGTGRIHQLTYQLKDAKDVATFDAAAAEVAQDLLIAVTPIPTGGRLPALPPMRPALSATSAPAEGVNPGSSSGAGTARSVDRLSSLARQASVSAPLRRQLIATAALAQQAEADPAQAEESQTLRDELQKALDLTAGLQTNTGVTAEERGQIESQLCDGLALFGDPRMRGPGRDRLAALNQYGELLGRVGKMRVPPELKDALAPALAWAHENPEQGDKVLAAVEKFVALYTRQQTRPQQPPEFAALRLIDPLRRAYEEVNKQFVKARGDFLGDAAGLAAGGGQAGDANGSTARVNRGAAARERAKESSGDDISTAAGPDTLIERVDAMTRLEDLLDVLVAMPRTFQTLNTYKPRPIGGMERHVNILLVAIDSPLKSPARDEATEQIMDLHKLATLAESLENKALVAVPPAVAQAYTGDEVAALQTKWKAMVTELAGTFAANQPMDADKLDRLKGVRELFDALAPVVEMEAAFARPEPLAKWADWTITPDQVHALLAPYQQAMVQAFGGFISDNPDALGDFGKLRPRFLPLIALFTRTAGYADACTRLPEGALGLLARLATPYEKAPFEDERFASFIASLTASASGDASVTDSAATLISNHLHR